MRVLLIFFLYLLCLIGQNNLFAQSCVPTGLNGTIINLPCGTNCSQIKYSVSHLKSTNEYSVVNIPYTPLPFVTPTGNEPGTNVYDDDFFSSIIPMPFSFCFYDSSFNQFVIGSNGLITFDISNSFPCRNAWKLETSTGPRPIPFVGAGICGDLTGPKYPKYSIMSPYHDIEPEQGLANKIEWRIEGVTPCRKLLVSFNNIKLFGDADSLNTSQIVVYESTGLIDIFIREKRLDPGAWNSNLAILGIQKDSTKALAAPGKNATVWREFNTGYRFVPSGGASRFQKAELYTFSGTLLYTTTPADTTTTTPGLLDISFPNNLCPATNQEQFIVKTYFSACTGSAQLVSSDTVTIKKTASLSATATTVASACGPNGSITINIPGGGSGALYRCT